MTTSTLDYRPLEQAMKTVARSCDGALLQDGMGFNAIDARFGQSVANLDLAEWDEDIAYAAWATLHLYQKQLATAGIEFDSLPRPPQKSEPKVGRQKAIGTAHQLLAAGKVARESRFTLSGPIITLHSPYNKELVADCQQIVGRAWDAGRKVNTFPVEAVRSVWDLAAKWNIDVPPVIADLPDVVQELPPEHFGVELVGRRVHVRFPYSPEMVATIKREIPGAAFDRTDKKWVITDESLPVAVQFAEKHNLSIEPGLSNEVEAKRAAQREMHAASFATEGTIDVGSKLELRPFQKAGVEFLMKSRKALLCDSMGLGKSVQGLATLVATNAFPAVVVCPSALRGVWVQEAAKFFPHLTVNVVNGGKPAILPLVDLTIINYDIVFKRAPDLIAIHPLGLVCDESHKLANGKAKYYCPNDKCGSSGFRANSRNCGNCRATMGKPEDDYPDGPIERWTVKRTEGVVRLSESMSADAVKLLLTGTPIQNRPIELASQLIIIDRIGEFGGRGRFAERYAPGGTGAAHLVELNQRLRATGTMIRRKKEDVYTELPPLLNAPVLLEIEPKARARYQEIENDVVHFLAERAQVIAEEAGEDGTAAYVAKKIRLEAVEHLIRINGLKTAISELKYDAVEKWIEEFLEDSDEKLIVMGERIQMIERLSERFGPVMSVKVRGSNLSNEKRDAERMEAVRRFQEDDECRLFIGSSIAASEGLTLTKASNIAMIEHPWTPAIVAQCIARCWGRTNDMHGATAWHLVVPDSIDLDIMSLLEAKSVVVDAATDGIELSERNGSVLAELLVKLAIRGGGMQDEMEIAV